MREKEKRTAENTALNIIGLILCLLMLPIVIVNMTMFIQSLIQPDMPPNFMGYTPLIVSSGSMSPVFDVTDMVIVKTPEDTATLKDGEIVCYLSGDSLVTHRIVDSEITADGQITYITQGDANNTPDRVRVSPAQIIGVYHTHIPNLGKFALFMQTQAGILLFVVLPLLILFVIYRIIDHRRYKVLLKDSHALSELGDPTSAAESS